MFIASATHTEVESSGGATCPVKWDALRSSVAGILFEKILYEHSAALRPGGDLLIELLKHDPSVQSLFCHAAWYCSSLTFSIQSTALPSSFSTMAMCVMDFLRHAGATIRTNCKLNSTQKREIATTQCIRNRASSNIVLRHIRTPHISESAAFIRFQISIPFFKLYAARCE
jgi:hypothetical protein